MSRYVTDHVTILGHCVKTIGFLFPFTSRRLAIAPKADSILLIVAWTLEGIVLYYGSE